MMVETLKGLHDGECDRQIERAPSMLRERMRSQLATSWIVLVVVVALRVVWEVRFRLGWVLLA